MDAEKYDAIEMLREVTERNKINLNVLIAETSLWANPEVHRRLFSENGTGAFFPNMRRYKRGAGERRGQTIGDVRLDDNSYANHAIKRSIGFSREKIIGFEACHIWPDTCYNEKCHTVIANLVLIPRPLAGLTDHHPDIQAVLKFRSFELYGWHPFEEKPPERPSNYPTRWREPLPFTPEIEKKIEKRKFLKRALA